MNGQFLSGRTAIVTGGAQGIGREYCKAVAARGAQVVAADIDVDAAAQTVAEIEAAGGAAIALELDVSDARSVAAFTESALAAAGPASILINNAAIYRTLQNFPLLEIDIGYWRKVMSVNLDGALLMTQAIAPQMIGTGYGRIINQSSIAAYGGRGSPYTISKLAIIGLTQGFANDLGPYDITVNAIAPGPVFTEATIVAPPPGAIDAVLAATPINRRVAPDGLNGLLMFLLSDGASWMTGQTFLVDGGYVKRI